MNKKQRDTLAARQRLLADLYKYMAAILPSFIGHPCGDTDKVLQCYWCWSYQFYLEEIIKIEDRIYKSEE